MQMKLAMLTVLTIITVVIYLVSPEPAKSSSPAVKSKHIHKEKVVSAPNSSNSNIYSIQAKSLDGKEKSLSDYKGNVLLIVNTASKCGYTPQYDGLEKLFEKYSKNGFYVLGFPCNQFGAQEPGTATEIASFCQKNYGVSFPMFAKIDVNGNKTHPLYKYLKAKAPGALNTEAIKWNFTKFLVDKSGKVIKRYAPNVKPSDIASDIERLISDKG